MMVIFGILARDGSLGSDNDDHGGERM